MKRWILSISSAASILGLALGPGLPTWVRIIITVFGIVCLVFLIISEIKALENKINNLIDMRAEGILSKEEFTKRHSKIQAEIDEKKRLLNVSAEEVPKDNAESFKASIRNIEQTLHAMSDFKGGASAAFMDKLISSVQVVNSNSYIFNIRCSENYTGAIKGNVSGRRNRAVVNIDEITGSPDVMSLS